MSQTPDKKFFKRADEHIHLSNDQMKDLRPGEVSASMMYATARFNAWLSARGFESAADMSASKQEAVDYFVAEFKQMLEENLEDYIKNFDEFVQPRKKD